ncbi:MAG: hypothetical protein H6707_19635 [Deltaproteobacteria bacterium]|nr:hypothetical protein [Deltaproteobacteria bacterium]
MLSNACVIPPATVTQDPSNTAPVVQLSSTIPSPQALVTAKQGEAAQFFVVFADPDPEDVTLRVFLPVAIGKLPDYTRKLDEFIIGPTSGNLRGAPVLIQGLCDGLVGNVPGRYDLEMYLSDTGFVDDGDDLRTPRVVDGRRGGRDSVRWLVDCVPGDVVGN